MTTPELPAVTVLMPAYNYETYVARAVESVLEQNYPAELLNLVVVDDGSTDETAAVVADLAVAHPGRIELIRQPNSGPSAAINRALAAATGELIAILDADDIWLPHKTRRQVDELNDPTLGMVFCDMTVVDGEERTVRPSQVGAIGAFPRRAFARLLFQNVATQSSIMLRRALAQAIPPEVPYSDWWFALRAAEVADVLYIPEPLALYREHGSNLTSGVTGAAGVREHRKEIAFQLWALRNLDLDSLEPAEIALAWRGVEEHARRTMQSAGSLFVELADVGDSDRERAVQLRAWAAAAVDHRIRCVALLRALGHNPYADEIRGLLMDALERTGAAGP
jgi:glycosyltransferase involved in cell wall biosynthesis